jgi:hypothetical protein
MLRRAQWLRKLRPRRVIRHPCGACPSSSDNSDKRARRPGEGAACTARCRAQGVTLASEEHNKNKTHATDKVIYPPASVTVSELPA